MNWDTIDWTALQRLRTEFLAGSAGACDYWQSESDLASYDATFAQRIGWKWDYVLAELTRRGWVPPVGELLDWGCGSGIAGRAFLDHFGTQSVAGLRVWDRSGAAMAFAARRARGKYPGLEVSAGLGDFPTTLSPQPNPLPRGEGRSIERLTSSSGQPAAADVTMQRQKNRNGPKASPAPEGENRGEGGPKHKILLLSHVLTELNPGQTEALMVLAAWAQCILWIEPGTYEVSRRLITIRERLKERFNVIAPCTHAAPCGMLSSGNERHWCHHFASPPREIFTDGNWSRFARLTGIDLRDLPLSFLVLDQRAAPSLPAGSGRVIGHPRVYKAHALLLGCDTTGVRERKLQQRTLPADFRALKKSGGEVLRVWDWAGDEIVASQPIRERSQQP
jgi:hypothetical protein